MQRSLRSMTAIFAATSALGCAMAAAQTEIADPSAPAQHEGQLTVLTKFGMQRLAPYFETLARQYEEKNPGVTIELIQEDDDSIKGKTKTLVASNSVPDIFFSWTGTWGGNFIRGKRAVDLTPVVGADSDWGKTFAPAAVDAFVYDGKNYGIPLYLDAKFMGYNKTIFADLGIAEPQDLEAMLAACDTIRDAGITPISFGNKEAWPGIHYLGQLLAYNVPRDVLERDFDPATAQYDHPGYVAALDQFGQILERCTIGAGVNGVSYQNAIQDLSDGRSAMYYQEIIEFDNAASAKTKLQPQDFGFFPLPAPKDAAGDPKALEGAPEGYMISTASANVPLALDFMKFVTTVDNAKLLSAPPFGQPSAVVGGSDPAQMSPAVVEGLQSIAEASYLMQWLDTVNHPRVAAAWLSGLQAFIGGTMSAEDVVTQVRDAAAAAG
ncbi:ABC transporter substrate-binding protein [Paracoccus sp. AK26]|uniref:ABC transporter substrate-binding protein n=1 Tax=Paracoccus sp. AK26 TaxID=2589076 RepID=UPI0014281FF2|nr:ABC transporter substrate-binding protein [Paracoccus sp. AK26]QIR86994.1 carbohydrate ABC transporter substrate-binding protein [Paracoccus sp. AK26]